jgi:hypothetical protein
MTTIDTIIYIEGADNDPVFYDAIVLRYQNETGRRTQVRFATELPSAALPNKGGSGGKQTLLRAGQFLERWRNRGAVRLLGPKEIAFCVDKDADDVLNKMTTSPAVIYTLMHSSENHLVLGTNLQDAICNALSITSQSLSQELINCDKLRSLAFNWREWVIYCLLSLHLDIRLSGNYGQESLFNNPAHAPTDPNIANQKFSEAKTQSGIPGTEFDRRLREITKLVEELIRTDKFDQLFKGKWYVSILYSLLHDSNSLRHRCNQCGKFGLWIGIRSKFVLDDGTYAHYREALARLR